MRRLGVYISLLICLPMLAYSQFEFNAGQLIKTVEFFNPGYNGVKDVTSASILYRGPFSNTSALVSPNYVNDLAYRTKAFNIHHPFIASKLGVGATIINESLGHRNNTIADLSLDVSVRTSQRAFLCLGISAGVNIWQYDLNNALHDYGSVSSGDYKHTFPHLAVGLHFVKRGMQLGAAYHIAIPGDSDKAAWIFGDSGLYNTFYVNGSIQFKLNSFLYIKPSLVAKMRSSDKTNFMIDSGVHFLIHDMVWLGASYRESWVYDAFSIMADLKVNDYLRLGYAFEHGINDIGFLNSSTHEFRIQLLIPRKTSDKFLANTK